MATPALTKSGNPRNLTDLNSTPPEAEDLLPAQSSISSVASGEDSKNKPVSVAEKSSEVEGSGEVTDVQKKMKRAERFGMPVRLSEKEKRDSRAERFGTGSTGSTSHVSKPSEELKRKARAERFGMMQSTPTDDEAKKKARLVRFGSSSPADEVEEDKKKARALRFSVANSGSKANGRETTESNAVVAGKAAGGT